MLGNLSSLRRPVFAHVHVGAVRIELLGAGFADGGVVDLCERCVTRVVVFFVGIIVLGVVGGDEHPTRKIAVVRRSEERRVGKECRL